MNPHPKSAGPDGKASPFDMAPEFYLEDNRQYRRSNPITRTVLDAKMRVLIPEWLVKNKSILDLGSCLGAAGHWALSYGATRYVGVEVQREYVDQSRSLLRPWGAKAEIAQADIRSFLLGAESASFDIVLAMGVMYLFIDPDVIAAEMCRVARETVAVESTYPGIQHLLDAAKISSAYLTYGFSQDVNMADGRYSLRGLAATPSPAAMDIYFRREQFVNKEGLLDYPRLEENTVYSVEAIKTKGIAARFGARYHRVSHQRELQTLEQCLPSRKGERRRWETSETQIGTESHEPLRSSKSNGKADAEAVEQLWLFDASVAKNFDRIAHTSIPNYDQVIAKSISIIEKVDFANPRIIDVGSAIGTTLRRLHEAGFRDLYGVDNSPAMLEQSFDDAKLICTDTFPSAHGPFDVVLANWVLHFISPRQTYLASIFESLAPGGLLILTEKVCSTPLCHDLYHDFKRANGLSEEEIVQKQRQLRGVLEQYPLEWYLTTLMRLGFESVEIIDAHFSFVSFMARKAAA
jgi:tRNA (cmo5U34)-methyltransferase